jgi:hypothetical protein
MPDALKSHVSPREARQSADDVVARWEQMDAAARTGFLNAVRFTELRGGALLAFLAETVTGDADARRAITRQARDEAKHGYFFSLILEHLGFEELPVAVDPLGIGDANPAELGQIPQADRLLGFLLQTEAIELRAAVTFEGLNRIFADDPFVSRYLNEIRYDEMFHLGWIGGRLDAMAAADPAIDELREQARDALAATIAAFESRVQAAGV